MTPQKMIRKSDGATVYGIPYSQDKYWICDTLQKAYSGIGRADWKKNYR